MSQKNFQIFRSQISDLKTDNVDYLKKPPWKKNFFDIFVIHLSSRYEKRCRILQRLFSLFQGSKNQLWNIWQQVLPRIFLVPYSCLKLTISTKHLIRSVFALNARIFVQIVFIHIPPPVDDTFIVDYKSWIGQLFCC